MDEEEAARKIQSVFRGYRTRKGINTKSFENPAYLTDSFESTSSAGQNIRTDDVTKNNNGSNEVAKQQKDEKIPNGTKPLKSALKNATLSAPIMNAKKSVSVIGQSYSDDDLTKRAVESKRPSLTARKSSIADIALTLTLPRPSGGFNGPLFDTPKNKGRNMYIHPYGNPLNAVERALMTDFDFDNESFGKSLVRVKPTASPGSLMVWVVFFFSLLGMAGVIIFVSETTRYRAPQVQPMTQNLTNTP